jgi:hypothetical protein
MFLHHIHYSSVQLCCLCIGCDHNVTVAMIRLLTRHCPTERICSRRTCPASTTSNAPASESSAKSMKLCFPTFCITYCYCRTLHGGCIKQPSSSARGTPTGGLLHHQVHMTLLLLVEVSCSNSKPTETDQYQIHRSWWICCCNQGCSARIEGIVRITEHG